MSSGCTSTGSILRCRARPRERGRQPLGLDGLEQIIERVDLEGAHGMVVVRGREDDARHVIEPRQQIEPRTARHLDVQEKQLRSERVDARHGFAHIARFAHDVDPGKVREQAPQLTPRQRFVIDDERFHETTSVARACGTRMRTMARSDCDRSSSSVARDPNSNRNLSAALYSPSPVARAASDSSDADCSPPRARPCHGALREIRRTPPPGNSAMPCLIAFSTTVCSSITGMRTSCAPAAISSSTRIRSPRRNDSSAR